jgi:hypothetical protein
MDSIIQKKHGSWKRQSKTVPGGGPKVQHLEAVNWFRGRWSSWIQGVGLRDRTSRGAGCEPPARAPRRSNGLLISGCRLRNV